jgi:hypothetical protein
MMEPMGELEYSLWPMNLAQSHDPSQTPGDRE